MSSHFVPQKLCEDSGLLSTGNAVHSLRVHVKGHRAMWSTSAAVVWSTWLICTIDLCSLRGGIALGKRLNLLSHVLTQEAQMYTAINLLWAWAASDYTYNAFCWCLLFFAPMVFNTSGRIWLMYLNISLSQSTFHSSCFQVNLDLFPFSLWSIRIQIRQEWHWGMYLPLHISAGRRREFTTAENVHLHWY